VDADDVYTAACTGRSGFCGDGGPAGSALFDIPDGVTLARSGGAPSGPCKPARRRPGNRSRASGARGPSVGSRWRRMRRSAASTARASAASERTASGDAATSQLPREEGTAVS
jgi:hypothetical protein